MKKFYLMIIISMLVTFLLACDFLTDPVTTTAIVSSTSQTTETTTTSTTFESGTTTTSESITTSTTLGEINEPFIPSGYSLLQDELDYVGIPTTGDVKILVFAVDFSDDPYYLDDISIMDIEYAFNGLATDTAYESLNSYYTKSSYGKLNLTADVFGYYRAEHPSSYYENEYEKLYAWNDVTNDYLYSEDEVTYVDSDIIFEVLSFYDDQIDYSDYDANNDGYIDGIYLIYTHEVSYYEGSDLWWAYQDYYAYIGDSFEGVEPNYFIWSGTDFFTEGDMGLNSRTIIHETGHMLGLDDYYDYDESDGHNSGGLGDADMMDNTIGDHNPASKLLLGWITPWVVTESMVVDLAPFENSGEVILLIDEWNGTLFDEYLLICFYTPTGVNYEDRYSGFSSSGVLIYHVDARIGNGYDDNSAYYTIFNYNNTDTAHKFIDIIEADGRNDIDQGNGATNTDLFQVNNVFRGTIFPNYDWYQTAQDMNFTIEITEKTATKTTIDIIFE